MTIYIKIVPLFENKKLRSNIMNFRVNIEQDESGYYVAEVPALPGCFSQGQTIAEATENIKEAITGWLAVMNDKVLKNNTLSLEVSV